MEASVLEVAGRGRLGKQLRERQPEHLTQCHQRRQPGVEGCARAGLPLLQLLVGVRRDAGEVGGPLLTQALLLARPLQAYADVAAVLLPGRSPRLSGHAPIVVAPCRRMAIPVWESADGPPAPVDNSAIDRRDVGRPP